jgi:hypothetical protein
MELTYLSKLQLTEYIAKEMFVNRGKDGQSHE